MNSDSLGKASIKVLVVDDVKDNIDLLCQILEDECSLITAQSGKECIDKALIEQPELILLDINMPEMDGYETMRILQQHKETRDILVIFVTAYFKESSMIVKGFELGAFDYIGKPVDDDILLAKVRVVKRIKMAEEMLSRSQKMDALGKLTGGIAHDYNNMLGVILGYTELLRSELSGSDKLLKYTKQIKIAGERGAKLTQKLLSFSRNSVRKATIVDINKVLSAGQHMLETTLTPRIKLTFDLKEHLWPVYLDSSDLEDVILNMSINAMHAIEANDIKGGALTFETSNETLSESDARRLDMEQSDYILLRVTDNGCGMSKAIREKIFDPFYSTKGDKGTGLGLSQVYGFVSRSGGVLDVHSEETHGTCFTLFFPRHHDVAASTLIENDYDSKNDLRGTAKILIVDDEPDLLELTSAILSEHGYRVLASSSASQALEMLEFESVDLLMSDIIMPDMNGYELASIVQDKYPDIKIQLVSGFSDGRHETMVDDELLKNLLHKPIISKELLSKLKALLG